MLNVVFVVILNVVVLCIVYFWLFEKSKRKNNEQNQNFSKEYDDIDEIVSKPVAQTFDEQYQNCKKEYEIISNPEETSCNDYSELSYSDLLKTQEWQDKRQKILERDGYRCRYCSSTVGLQVHHKYYSVYPNGVRAYPWNYPDDALITLCDICHKKVHLEKKIKTYYRRYIEQY